MYFFQALVKRKKSPHTPTAVIMSSTSSHTHTQAVRCSPNQEVALHQLRARTRWPVGGLKKSGNGSTTRTTMAQKLSSFWISHRNTKFIKHRVTPQSRRTAGHLSGHVGEVLLGGSNQHSLGSVCRLLEFSENLHPEAVFPKALVLVAR